MSDTALFKLIILIPELTGQTPRGGGGVLPIMAYTGRLRPKGVPFFRLQVYKRVGISQVEICKRVRKSVTKVFNYIFRIDAPCGCISLFIKHYMKMRTRLPKVGM